MKFTVLQQDLLRILQAVSRSVGVRSTLPVLDNLLLSVEDKRLKVAATNLEIGVIKYLPVEVEEVGELTIPAKTLVDLIGGVNSGKVGLQSSGEILTVSSGKFKASLNGIAAVEFPAIPLSSTDGISFPKESLLSSSQILFASAVDEGRPVLTGILMTAGNGKLDFVATDGFRLAHRQLDLAAAEAAKGFKSLIPKRTFEELLRLISEEEVETVKISTSENQNQVVFSLGQTIISSRLIEGNFPNWEKIIPQQIISRVVVDKEEFIRAIKLAAVFARNEANIVILTLKKNTLSLKSSAKELGSQENEIDVDFEGETLQIAFNNKFLLDAISNCPSSQITIEFSGLLSAAVIKPVGSPGLEYIVMPVRLN